MRVVLIGSNGLLANSIGKYCNESNFDLIVFGIEEPVHHSYLEFIRIDLLNEEINLSAQLSADVIIYAVGAGVQSNLKEDTEVIYNLNVFMPVKISNELDNLNYMGTFVTFGSYFEIGSNLENKLFTEIELAQSVNEVPNDYCVSKRMLTRYVNSRVQKNKHLHLILPTIYGEHESIHRLIPYTISTLKNGGELKFTGGQQVRQYLYIDDLPHLLFQMINISVDGVFNVSGSDTFTVRELVHIIFQYYDLDLSEAIFGGAQRVDVGMVNLQIDASKLNNVIANFKFSKLIDIINKYDLCL